MACKSKTEQLGVKQDKLAVESQRVHRYTLNELVAQCSRKLQHLEKEDREWLDNKSVGRELI